MKALIAYKDWLLLERGEIRPEIGDKIHVPYATGGAIMSCKVAKIEQKIYESSIRIYRSNTIWCFIDTVYVEIDYNYKDAIEFASYLADCEYAPYPRENSNMYYSIYDRNDKITLEELYKKFKQEQNDKGRNTSTD